MRFWNNWFRKKIPRQPATRDWEEEEAFKRLPVQILISWSRQKDGCFIVFINTDENVDYKTTGECDQLIRSKECGKVLSRIAVLEAVPIYHLPEETRLAFRCMLGEGLARALHDDYANARELINAANQFVSARNQETARRWFVSAAAIVATLCCVIGFIFWLNRAGCTTKFGEHFIPLIIATTFGAIGALFSVLTRASKIPLDPAAGRFMHYVEAIGHVVAGMIGGVFVYLAMKVGIIAPKLSDVGLAGQALACLVGGTSERLVPTIIHKVDLTKADIAKNDKEHA